jgi:hypothetical protein
MNDLDIGFLFEEPLEHEQLTPARFDCETDDIPERLLDKAVTHLHVQVAGRSEFVRVDDDAEFIADACVALERILIDPLSGVHHSLFLGDGRLTIDAVISDSVVLCTVKHFENLRADREWSTNLSMSKLAYISAWRRVAAKLVAAVKGPSE